MSRRIRRLQEPGRSLGCVSQRHAGDGNPVRKGRKQARGHGAIEHDENAAIIGAADEPPVGLAQPQPGYAIGVGAKAARSRRSGLGPRPTRPHCFVSPSFFSVSGFSVSVFALALLAACFLLCFL